MKMFIICPVRLANKPIREKLERYAKRLEKNGHYVHLPHRDTNQNGNALSINTQNFNAMKGADEVHIFYLSASQGIHFDIGMAFSLGKKIVIAENEIPFDEKSYSNLINILEEQSK